MFSNHIKKQCGIRSTFQIRKKQGKYYFEIKVVDYFSSDIKHILDHNIQAEVNEVADRNLGPQAREIKAQNFQGFCLTSLIMQYKEKPEKGRGSDMK